MKQLQNNEAKELIQKMKEFKDELVEKVEVRYHSLDKRIVSLEDKVSEHSDHLKKIKYGLAKEGDRTIIG